MRTLRRRAGRSPSAAARRVALVLAVLSSACGGAGSSQGSGGSGDWYYHWNCNGDSWCLSTNPTGQAIGTVDEGPQYAMCSPLLEFATRNWGPAAWNTCDQSASFPRVLLTLVVAPANAQLALGSTQQYTATARYSDGSSADVTGQVAWGIVTVTGSGVASISAGGLLTTLSQGTATVSARLGSLTATTSLGVGPVAIVSVEVAPTSATIAKGQTQPFTATAHWSDGHTTDVTATAYWASGTTAASMTGAVATGLRTGTTTISATTYAKTGTALLTVTGPALVSVTIRPDAPKVAAGTARQLTAIGLYTDGTAEDVTLDATWASSATAVAAFPAPGVADGVAPGDAAVSASLGDVAGLTTVTVTPATLGGIAISPAEPSVGPGETLSFSAIGSFSDGTSYPIAAGVTWATSAPATVPVDPSGLATALAVGTAGISASYDGVVGATTVTVSSSPPGTAWTWRPTGCTQPGTSYQSYNLTAIVWTGSQLVAGGPIGYVLTSPDGVSWTCHAEPSRLFVSVLAYAPELGLVVGLGGDASGFGVFTSPDGVTWTRTFTPAAGLSALAWSGTQFVAAGSPTTGNALVYTSPDGVAWTQRDVGTRQVLDAVAWNGSEFVATGNATVVSGDGVHWALSTDTSSAWSGIASSGKKFVRVKTGAGQVSTSSDGVTWTTTATLNVDLYAITWAGNRFVVVGPGTPAYVATSPDGVTWTRATVGSTGLLYGAQTSSALRAIAWTGTRFVAVGTGVYPTTASDGDFFIETSP